MRRWLLLAWLLVASPAFATNYYVATTGSNAADGSISTPWLTVEYACLHVTSNDVINIRSGTYEVAFRTGCVNGTNGFANPITIQNYASETVTWINSTTAGGPIIQWGGGSYIFKGSAIGKFVIDGSGSPNGCIETGGAYIRFDTLDIEQCPYSGININILSETAGSHHIEVLNSKISYAGRLGLAPDLTQPHAIYAGTADSLFDNNELDHAGCGYGIQIFSSGHFFLNNNIVSNNRIHHNSVVVNGCGVYGGMIITSGYNNVAFNNLIYNNNGPGLGIAQSGFCGDCAAYNNTIYGNTNFGVWIGHGSAGSLRGVVKGNIIYGNGDTVFDDGVDSVISSNVSTNPSFVDTMDFEIPSGSTAVHAGPDLTSLGITALLSDFNGNSRPNGSAWDAGAKQFAGSCTPAKVIITSQPGNAVTGATLGTFSVAIQSSGSLTCASATNTVTLAKTAGATWGTLNSTGGLAKAVVSGVYDWTDLYVSGATGSGTITASSPGLTSAVSNSITISAPPSNCTGAGPISQCTKYVDDTGVGDSSITTPNLGSSVTVGHTIIVGAVVGCKDAGCSVTTSNPVTSVTDSKGNTYTLCASSATNLLNQFQIFSAPVVTGGSSFNVTIDWTNPNYYILATVFDVSGIAGTPCDKTATAHDVVAPATVTASASTIDFDEFVYEIGAGPSPLTINPPFASLNNAPNRADGWKVAGPPVVETGGFDIGDDGYWTMLLAAFRTTGTPALLTPDPGTLSAGTTVDVVAVGSHTSFSNGVSTCGLGSGITVNTATVTDVTHITCNVTIASNASPGLRNVTITTGGEVVTATGLLNVLVTFEGSARGRMHR